MSAVDVSELIRTANGLPHGRARIALTEEAVEAAGRAGDPLDLTRARLALHRAYVFGGEPAKGFLPFTQVLRDHDAGTHEFDADLALEVLRHLKWVAWAVKRFPTIPLSTIEAGLDRIEGHARAAGRGMQSVAAARMGLTWHVHGAAAAEEAYRRWRTLPRDEVSDCQACETRNAAAFLYDLGRDADGLELSARLRHETSACSSAATSLLSTALLPLVRTGDPATAARHHARSVELDGGPSAVEELDDHLLFLALTGNEPRGLELLRLNARQLEEPASPWSEHLVAAAAARLLEAAVDRAGDDLTVTTTDGQDVAASELARRCADRARSLAAEFDARNGTTTVSRGVERTLTAERLSPVPLVP